MRMLAGLLVVCVLLLGFGCDESDEVEDSSAVEARCYIVTEQGDTTVRFVTGSDAIVDVNGVPLTKSDDVTYVGSLSLVEGDVITMNADLGGEVVSIDMEQPSSVDASLYHTVIDVDGSLVRDYTSPFSGPLGIEWPLPSFVPDRVNVELFSPLSDPSRGVGTSGGQLDMPLGTLPAGLLGVSFTVESENFYAVEQGQVCITANVSVHEDVDSFDTE